MMTTDDAITCFLEPFLFLTKWRKKGRRRVAWYASGWNISSRSPPGKTCDRFMASVWSTLDCSGLAFHFERSTTLLLISQHRNELEIDLLGWPLTNRWIHLVRYDSKPKEGGHDNGRPAEPMWLISFKTNHSSLHVARVAVLSPLLHPCTHNVWVVWLGLLVFSLPIFIKAKPSAGKRGEPSIVQSPLLFATNTMKKKGQTDC